MIERAEQPRARRRLSGNDLALIGIVLVALGITALADGGLRGRVLLAAALWLSALPVFAAARHHARRS